MNQIEHAVKGLMLLLASLGFLFVPALTPSIPDNTALFSMLGLAPLSMVAALIAVFAD